MSAGPAEEREDFAENFESILTGNGGRAKTAPSGSEASRLHDAFQRLREDADGRYGPAMIGDYRRLGLVGTGGHGAVFLVANVKSGRLFALKTPFAYGAGAVEEEDRFLREGAIAQRLSHENIVAVVEVGRDVDRRPFMVSEFIADGSLEGWLASAATKLDAVLELAIGIARGLAAAHTAGVVHRDLKPSNVLLHSLETPDGIRLIPKLCDFGLGAFGDSPDLTVTGVPVGTLGYVAPEQAMGDRSKVGPASDVFSFGCLLFWMLTGRVPYDSPNLIRNYEAQKSGLRPRLRELRMDAPQAVETLVENCLAFHPDDRYPSAETLLGDLERVQATRSIARRVGAVRRIVSGVRMHALHLSLAALLVAAGVVWWMLRAEARRDVPKLFIEAGMAVASRDVDGARTALDALARSSPTLGRTFLAGHLEYLADELFQPAPVKIHSGRIRSLRYAPDGTLLAVGGAGGLLQIWDVKSWSPLRMLKGHNHEINSIVFDASGSRMISGDDAGVVVLWDIDVGKRINEWKCLGSVESIAADPTFSAVFLAGPKGARYLRPAIDREPKVLTKDFARAVCYDKATKLATFTLDHPRKIATVLSSWTLDRTDAPTEKSRSEAPSAPRSHVILPEGGDEFLLSSRIGTTQIFNALTGTTKVDWNGSSLSFAFRKDPRGRFHAGAYADGTVKVWHSSADPLVKLQLTTSRLWSMDIAPDGSRLAAGGDDGVLYAVNVSALPFAGATIAFPVMSYESPMRLVPRILHSAPGAQQDTVIASRVGRPERMKRIQVNRPPATVYVQEVMDIDEFAVSSLDPERFIAATRSHLSIRRAADLALLKSIPTSNPKYTLLNVVASPNGRQAALLSTDRFDVIDLETGLCVIGVRTVPTSQGSLAWLPSGYAVYASIQANRLLSIQPDRGTSRSVEVPGLPSGGSLAFLDEHRLLAAAGGRVFLIEVSSGRMSVLIDGRQIECLALDSERVTLATGSRSGEVAFWDPQSAMQLFMATAHPGKPVVGVEFATNNRLFISTASIETRDGEDMEVRYWPASNDRWKSN